MPGARGLPEGNTIHKTWFASSFQSFDGPRSLPDRFDDSGPNDGMVPFFSSKKREEIGKLEKGATVSNFDLEKLCGLSFHVT